MDVVLAGITYPMFISQGVEIMKGAIGASDREMDELKANKLVTKLFDFILVPYSSVPPTVVAMNSYNEGPIQ